MRNRVPDHFAKIAQRISNIIELLSKWIIKQFSFLNVKRSVLNGIAILFKSSWRTVDKQKRVYFSLPFGFILLTRSVPQCLIFNGPPRFLKNPPISWKVKIGRLCTPKWVFKSYSRNRLLSHLASELTNITMLKEIQALIVE